jgi:signal transduction histidine kinase/CheY-like chemotaxis protein
MAERGVTALFSVPELDRFAKVFAEDTGNLPGRCVTIGVLAASFGAFVGWPFAFGWFILCLALVAVVAPYLQKSASAAARPVAWDIGAISTVVMIQAVTGGLAVYASLRGGLPGLLAGEFLLFCLVMIATSTARQSAIAYYAAVAPLSLCMLALSGMSFTIIPSVATCIILVVGTVFFLGHTHQIACTSRDLILRSEEARAAAEAATAAKSSFVAMVSHELRTPMSGILASAAELQADAQSARSRNNAALVTQAGEMMRALLNDLLDLSKIEAGRLDVEIEPFDLRRTLLDTVRFWRPELRRKGLYLRLDGTKSLPQWVAGDGVRLRQILNNLFSNAAKFTSEGGLSLRTSAEVCEEGVRIALDVTDTGPGMSEDQTRRLFSAFEQLGASTARKHGGTGLGLHISRELARLMGGDIVVTSEPGVGSTFRILLTLPTASAPALPPVHADSQVEPAGFRLLVVDDHHVNRQAFGMILEPFAERVVCAEDGEQALALLAVESFDVVLMDLHMPNLDGREATARLRATPGPNRHTPVIALTGSVSTSQVDACLAAGMTSFVMKPVTPAELLVAVDHALNSARAPRGLKAHAG